MSGYWIEIISWIGLLLGVGAFFIKELSLLRLCTVVGSALMSIYYFSLDANQGVIANVIMVGINLYYLLKERSKPRVQLVNATEEKLTL